MYKADFLRKQRERFVRAILETDPNDTIQRHNISYWWRIHMEGRMLLFPDMSRQQHEAQEFCFADPCTKDEWRQLKHQGHKPDEWLPFVIKQTDEGEAIAIILRGTYDTDEDCLSTAAWLRMVQEFSGMIYALPFKEGSTLAAQTMSQIIARTAGVPFFQVRHIEV